MLAQRFDVIGVEELNDKAMTCSAKGTMDKPGRNVAGKAGLNRETLANAWGNLVQRLEHKAPGRVICVRAAYTSQTCHACGHCAARNRESQAVFCCVACGHSSNADVNAAINIATAAGRAVAAREACRWASPRTANLNKRTSLRSRELESPSSGEGGRQWPGAPRSCCSHKYLFVPCITGV
jgi:transposase